MTNSKPINRRRFLQTTAATAVARSTTADEPAPMPRGLAQHCIFLWMGGGMALKRHVRPETNAVISTSRIWKEVRQGSFARMT